MKRFLIFIAASCLFAGALQAQELANFARGGQRVVSPDVQGDSVTFRMRADYATVVKLSGSWMTGWGGVDMRRGENNVWSIKLPLPAPEIYTYNFIVDGVSVNDPQNVMVQRDGTRFLNMFIVDGDRTANVREASQRGTVSHPWYDSQILGINRRLTVYTPYGYEANPKTKYPVLYLLHGAGGDEEAWISMGRTAQIMDNLIEKGLAKPMIVVMPNGNPGQSAARTLGIPEKQMDFRSPELANAYVRSLVEEIVPFIDKNFRTISKKASRAIAGLSMGGGHTIAASGLYPDAFDYICPLSMGAQRTDELDARLQGIKKSGYKLYFLACGETDFLFNNAKELDAALTANGLEHTFYVSDGGHTWPNWRLYLNVFAPLLFK